MGKGKPFVCGRIPIGLGFSPAGMWPGEWNSMRFECAATVITRRGFQILQEGRRSRFLEADGVSWGGGGVTRGLSSMPAT